MRPNATYTLSGLSFSGRNQHCDFNSFRFFILFWTINPKKVVRISREEYLDIGGVTKQNVLSHSRPQSYSFYLCRYEFRRPRDQKKQGLWGREWC